MEGGRNYDSLPGDITRRIFSLLPLYLVLRLRLVCKAWYALITEFAAEYLNRSKETSLGIICGNSRCISSGVFSLDISSLQIRGGIKTLMTKTLSISPRFAFNGSIKGLICFDDAKNNIHVFNPTTGEFVTLPPAHLSSYIIGIGYCPLTKQYKAVKIFQDFIEFATPVKAAAVITVGAPSNSWRFIESSPPYKCIGPNVYLNGTLFWLSCTLSWWLSYTEEIMPLAITAFDVSDETFRIIRLPPKVLSRNLNCLAEQEGRLCLVKFDAEKEYFEIYIMLEDFQWISQYRVSIKDFEPHCANNYFSSFQFLCLKKGKITLWSKLMQRWIFYDIKSRAIETIQVGDANEKMIASSDLLICPYEESLTPICNC